MRERWEQAHVGQSKGNRKARIGTAEKTKEETRNEERNV